MEQHAHVYAADAPHELVKLLHVILPQIALQASRGLPANLYSLQFTISFSLFLPFLQSRYPSHSRMARRVGVETSFQLQCKISWCVVRSSYLHLFVVRARVEEPRLWHTARCQSSLCTITGYLVASFHLTFDHTSLVERRRAS